MSLSFWFLRHLQRMQLVWPGTFGVVPLTGQEQPHNFYNLADQALYQAKQKEKNRVGVITQKTKEK